MGFSHTRNAAELDRRKFVRLTLTSHAMTACPAESPAAGKAESPPVANSGTLRVVIFPAAPRS